MSGKRERGGRGNIPPPLSNGYINTKQMWFVEMFVWMRREGAS